MKVQSHKSQILSTVKLTYHGGAVTSPTIAMVTTVLGVLTMMTVAAVSLPLAVVVTAVAVETVVDRVDVLSVAVV